jgi:putative AlgH/UPF0301 family transcriptional regulator
MWRLILYAILAAAAAAPASSFVLLSSLHPSAFRRRCHQSLFSRSCERARDVLRTTAARPPALLTLSARHFADDDREAIFKPLREAEVGCVLVASPEEIEHFARQAVVLVVSHNEQGTRGVLLEMATAFSVGEMAEALAASPFAELPLFRGGSGGKDQILMLHDVAGLARSQPVGAHGIHVGGIQSASDAVSQGLFQAERFKFFFNQQEWVPGALEREIMQGIWTPGIISPALVLRQIGSQSERPLAIQRKLGQLTTVEVGKPLWDLLRENLPDSVNLEALLKRSDKIGATSFNPATPAGAGTRMPLRREEQEEGGDERARGATVQLSALKRVQLQALAKENGIKANLKSVEIIEQLVEKNVSVLPSDPTKNKEGIRLGIEAQGGGREGEGGGDELGQVSCAVGGGAEGAVGQRALFLSMMVERVW